MTETEKHQPAIFKIIVDHRPHDWPHPFITGKEIKDLAKVNQAEYDAWLDVPGPDDELVEDNRQVDLRKPGVEKFFTGKRKTTEG